MITLLTGLPGNGKGVYGIDMWKAKAEREGRTVYYSGITDCRVPGWIPMEDSFEWFELPVGAMIFIDECQEVFRVRAAGSQVPEHVAHLEKHRHQGHDLLLVTQHPMLIDQNVRRLVGEHLHIVRQFGMERATVHRWMQVNEQPHKTRRDSVRTTYRFNPDIYQLYKSAELHTVKRKIPARVFLLFALIALVPLLLYFGWQFANGVSDNIVQQETTEEPAQETQLTRHTYESAAVPGIDWYAAQAPRVESLPATAPKYDEVTKPVRAPRPAACVLMRGECRCYTQQATRMNTDDAVCRQIVENGYFLDYDDKPLPKDNNPLQYQTTQQTVLQPEAPAGGETVGPASADVPAEPEGRSPSKVARDRMASTSYAFKYPGAIAQ